MLFNQKGTITADGADRQTARFLYEAVFSLTGNTHLQKQTINSQVERLKTIIIQQCRHQSSPAGKAFAGIQSGPVPVPEPASLSRKRGVSVGLREERQRSFKKNIPDVSASRCGPTRRWQINHCTIASHVHLPPRERRPELGSAEARPACELLRWNLR